MRVDCVFVYKMGSRPPIPQNKRNLVLLLATTVCLNHHISRIVLQFGGRKALLGIIFIFCGFSTPCRSFLASLQPPMVFLFARPRFSESFCVFILFSGSNPIFEVKFEMCVINYPLGASIDQKSSNF